MSRSRRSVDVEATPDDRPMMVTVNDKEHQLADDSSVRDLVVALGLGEAPVAVEVNRRLVPRGEHETARLHDGDHVEIVTLVGGG